MYFSQVSIDSGAGRFDCTTTTKIAKTNYCKSRSWILNQTESNNRRKKEKKNKERRKYFGKRIFDAGFGMECCECECHSLSHSVSQMNAAGLDNFFSLFLFGIFRFYFFIPSVCVNISVGPFVYICLAR